MIEQAVTNLLSNAIKFAPRESLVEVGVDLEPRVARVWVRDEGPGISAEDRARIFQKFAQARSSSAGWETGAGLGLYIVERIVTAHGGQVFVDSEVDVGTTMSFTLPLSRPDAGG
ncbi:MAG: sensor histidine kinase [Candidatus Riflebacteria bacterium]|nr:sensor histidine kinase [Candidatus Riflebacteria bacterium]